MNLPASITRRRALATIGGASLATLFAACSSDSNAAGSTTSAGQPDSTSTGDPSGTTATSSSNASCVAIPQETAGPFPGDGTNGPNVLNVDGVVRNDLRSSFGDLSGTAEGIALTVDLVLTDAQDGCTPLAGAAIYVWHTDAAGRYSLYSDGAVDQNYLRGVQVSDGNGNISFTTVFPGCYDGRWPHIHFEVYDDFASAKNGGSPRSTSQLAFPQATCAEAYADARYPSSAASLARVSLASDNVFGDDGAQHQLATMTGSPADGYTAKLNIAA